VRFMSKELTTMSRNDLREIRRDMQIVFQDPYSSLNPRMTVGNIVAEPLTVHGVGTRRSREASVRDLLETVGFNPDFTNRYPHEFTRALLAAVPVPDPRRMRERKRERRKLAHAIAEGF